MFKYVIMSKDIRIITMVNRYRLCGLFVVSFFYLTALGQFCQQGVALEYNRKHAKSIYCSPISLNFSGAPTTKNKTDGRFVLDFKTAHASDTIKGFTIDVVDNNYVLFNKDRIQGWVLTSQKDMEIVVCRKDIIDYLVSTYTNNYVNQLKRQYEAAQKELRQTVSDKNELQKSLELLQTNFESEKKMIMARAVLFAYVDETEIDSLEQLRRQCILDNDMDGAYKIGEQMNLSKLCGNYIQNIKISKEAYNKNLKNLYEYSSVLEEHIQICQSLAEPMDSIDRYIESLEEVYRVLLQELKDQTAYEKIYHDIQSKLGKILYEKDSIVEAANLGNSEALWSMILYEELSYEERKHYAGILYDNVVLQKNELPLDADENLVKEIYESFPDFKQVNDGNVMYFHCISDNEVSLVHFEQTDSSKTNIKVPEIVKHDNKEYIVTKIGIAAFIPYEDTHNGDVWTIKMMKYDKSDCYFIRSISLPQTIRYIGTSAFCGYGWADLGITLNFPKSLKIIRDNALSGIKYKNDKVVIPEGVEEIEEAWQGWNEEMYTFEIPSTVRKISAFSGMRKNLVSVRKIVLSPANEHFTLINNMLYTADSTEVYLGSIPVYEEPKILFIPRKLRTNIHNILDVHCSFDSISFEKGNPLYKFYEGVVYDNALEKMIYQPDSVKKLKIPATLNDIQDLISGLNAESIEIPKETARDVVIDLLNFFCKVNSKEITLIYYGKSKNIKNRKDIIEALADMASLHSDDNLSYLRCYFMLEEDEIQSAIDLYHSTNWSDVKTECEILQAIGNFYLHDKYLRVGNCEPYLKFAEDILNRISSLDNNFAKRSYLKSNLEYYKKECENR